MKCREKIAETTIKLTNMKTIVSRKKAIIATLAAILFTTVTFAQATEKKEDGCRMNIPGLTNEQKSKIEGLKVPHMQTMNAYRAELEKLHAELRILEIADNPDLNKLNAKIDEISAVQNKIEKERAKHHLAVRALLTPEQRVAFDMHQSESEGREQIKHCKGEQGGKHCGEGQRGEIGEGHDAKPNHMENTK
jgi:Spy/CpxP family protein refolding chaperone